MKNLKSILLIGVSLFAMSVSASASLYTDTNTHNEFLSEGESVEGQWSFGPIASGETITKIDTWFKFSDTDSASEQVHVALGIGDGNTDATWTSGTFNFGSNYTFNWTFNSGASLFADAANGLLSYRVTATNVSQLTNDLTFNWAKVDVTTTSNRVPDDSSTIAFLGLGMVALAGMQRKFRAVR